MKTKSMPATYAPPIAGNGDTAGFEAIVSVFNNVDHGGDVVRPGAFARTIKAWAASGDPIPVLWSHRTDDPSYNIGAVLDIAELMPGDPRIPTWADPWVKDNGGLWVKAELDDHGAGHQARHLLTARRVTQFSFAYDVIEERRNAQGHNELLSVWLHEVGPTPLGMNPLTALLSGRVAALSAPRRSATRIRLAAEWLTTADLH
jgi:phage head maturation protease